MDFWPSCGYSLLERRDDGRLVVTEDYLRFYFSRPELELIEGSCNAERALRQKLLDTPRADVSDSEIAAVADEDARANYTVMLRFRAQLAAAPTLESFYFDVFRRDIAVPPDFLHQTAQVILRGILDGVDDGLEVRAAEIFFRPQSVSVQHGAVMLADQATVLAYANHGGLGDVGRFLKELQAPLASAELDVLDRPNHGDYFARDERHDLVIQMNPGGAGADAYARVLEKWIAHFHGVGTTISPVREIPDDEWVWHVGLDAEATSMLNDIYNGADVEEQRMKRVVALFRLEFHDAHAMRTEIAGSPVFLGLAMTPESTLRMKPQNLLMNLPLATRA